jgi:autotransporter strand-loop-strand O-heptosyltransferase
MKVKIILNTSSLGDTIGAVAQVNKYQKITNYEVNFCINDAYKCLFENSYPNIKFNSYNFEYDEQKKINFYFDRPLQKGFSDDLGMDYEELETNIDNHIGNRFIKQKYITISTHSTHQGRYWNNVDGWNDLIKYLKSKYNISTVCIDRDHSFGIKSCMNPIPNKAIDRCGINLKDCVNYISHAEFHVGTSNGLSWLAHGLKKHVVLISNVTKPWCEFSTNITRIYDDSICNGCLNEEKFDPTDWLWCPRKKNFECTRKISFESFKIKIDNLVSNL